MRTFLSVVEQIARVAGATFLATWTVSGKFDAKTLEYAGTAAAIAGATSLLAVLKNGDNSPIFVPQPAPTPPKA